MGSVNNNTLCLPDQPLAPPPPGLIPDLALLKSRALAVYIAASICLPLILLFAALRFYAKAVIIKRIRWNDGEFNAHRQRFIWLFIGLAKP